MSEKFNLGDTVQISIGNVLELDANIDFYQKLGFELIGRDTKPYPWANLSDGAIRIVLNQDKMEYFGLTYFAEDMQKRGQQLEKMGIEFLDMKFNVGDFYQKIFVDPNNFGISIIEVKSNLTTMPKLNVKKSVSLGRMGELAIAVTNLEQSIEFWQKLGYHVCGKYEQPDNWAILMDREMMIIGLHETQSFTKPTITYFDKNMSQKITELKESGVTVEDFMDANDEKNKVAISPSGHKIFLFTGDLSSF